MTLNIANKQKTATEKSRKQREAPPLHDGTIMENLRMSRPVLPLFYDL
ncbi:MAG: hypothetical protein ACXIUW_17960 [Roseinatronobacter sp.]